MLDDVLLSWSDLVLMGILSKNFPLLEFFHQSGNACFGSVDEACDALLLEFRHCHNVVRVSLHEAL